MMGVALRIVNDRMEAEDVLQESFVKAFAGLAKFRAEASFGSWLKRIVINHSINQVKRRRMHFDELNEEILHKEEDEQYAEPEYTVEDVKKAVRELPDGYRVIFTLYMFEDLSHKEIANQLEISESTSKSQLNRAKKRLRQALEHYERR